jgi:prolyl-tRNA editing enzyme YbaK/EbsC (Cys-tRNA(Pro) deacylase)
MQKHWKSKSTKQSNNKYDFPIKTETAIFENNVILFTGGKKYNSVVINSENLANTFKQVFMQIWEGGEVI